MNVRPKLLLAEVTFSVALFLSVLFSISSFVNFIGFENLKIETATLQDTASRLKFSIIGMQAKTEPASFLTLEYQLLAEEMTQNLELISEDRMFDRLPEDKKELFIDITEDWGFTQKVLSPEEITEFLNLRELADSVTPESIATILALARENADFPVSYLESLENAEVALRQLERNISLFEATLGRALNEMRDAADVFKQLQLVLAISVPAVVLILAYIAIILFAGNLSRKLKRLDQTLSDVAGGDFSVRIDMKGQDEFTSLATSINAFTRTLGAKLESFRLIMHDIGQTLSTSIDSTQVESTLLKLAMRETVADGAALYKVGGESGELLLSQTEGKFRPPFTVTDLPETPAEEDINAILRSRIIQPGQTLLGESAIQGRAGIVRNVEIEESLDWARPKEDPLFISSIIVVPLIIGSTVFGVLAITSSKTGNYFSDLDYANMQSFGELAAITLDNIYKYADLLEATQLNREIGIAEEIQQDLLPKRLPRIPGGEIAYLSRSIKGLNGDYFDVYPMGDGKTMVTICEVAGKGVPAGLVMVMIRTILRLVATKEKDAKMIMTQLNQDMTRRIAIENYASVGILIIDSDGKYTFSSAAHYPLQILRSVSDSYEAIQTEGIPVGIDKTAVYQQQSGVLNKDDLVLFHTDGVPEARDRQGRVFGINSLLEAVSGQSEKTPELIIETLRTELEHFERGTNQKDDQTVIVLKYSGGSAA